MTREPHRATWLGSDRFIVRTVAKPIHRFLHVEAAGGIVLFAAAFVAIAWVNSPWRDGYDALWHTEVSLHVGRHVIAEDLRHWVNDGLMALFFFAIGLEIKNEFANGELRQRSKAAVPIAGALGGMVVPAAIFALVAGGGEAGAGWGIPMATDVAFALGALALLGSRVPHELKVLLLALAIVDDVGAIVVIALFYSSDLSLGWVGFAAAGLGVTVVLRRAQVRYLPLYVAVGAAVWWATFESGVHATIAGVALGLLTPARPLLSQPDADGIADELSSDTDVTASEVRAVSFRLRESVPMTDRLLGMLHPWTSYVVIPLFALANAGVEVSGGRLGDAATSRVTLGVVAGLVVGKAVGVVGGIALAVRSGLARLPDGLTSRHLLGLGLIAGIGFTVSIFIGGLAFEDPDLVDSAKLGILVASGIAAVAGTAVLRGAGEGSRNR
jgi:NhaA family Na+:H+ antiporter